MKPIGNGQTSSNSIPSTTPPSSTTKPPEKIPGTSINRVSREQVISNNIALAEYGNEMTINATYVYQTLTDNGWSKNATCAVLGNMQVESYLNPGKGEDSNSKTGYGLVQWTPYMGIDYYGDWADANSLPRNDIDTQLQRILAEVSTPSLAPVQWCQKSGYPDYGMSFYEFTQSSEPIDYLTEVFMGTHEGPSISTNHLDKRKKYAYHWDNYFQ